MNLYLLAFSLYGLFILPLNLHFRFRLGKNTGYWLRIETAGLPFSSRRSSRKLEEEENKTEKKGHSLSELNIHLIRILTEKKTFRRLLLIGTLRRLNLFVRYSFSDAALTALLFSASRIVLDTLHKLEATPECFDFSIRADFQNSGSMLIVDGILSARLGKLLSTFILLGWSYVHYRREHLLQMAQNQPSV